MAALMTVCPTCGDNPCRNPSFCAASRDTGARKARETTADGLVDAREIFERARREAEAGQADNDEFTMETDRGLTVKVATGSGKKEREKILWLSAPFEIVGRVRDPKSESWAWLLLWKDNDNQEHQYAVADSDLHGDLSALCATLAARGLKIATGVRNRAFLAQYLNTRSHEKRITIVPRTGWHIVNGKRVFALPGEGIGIDDQIILAADVTASHYTSSGTLEEWQNSVAKLVEAHSRARFAVASAFASPLLALIGADGGGINLRGPSSIGKTTLLAAAASVWGRGDERGLIRTWRGTGNGIEAAATQFSDTFLPLDEIGVASGHEVGNVVYSIAGGIGKQRANRDGSAKLPNTWRIFILSTGEISISDKIREGGKRARAGQEIRVLDINADAGKSLGVFDVGDNPEELARKLRQAAVNSYGTAGPAFIRAIIAKTDDVAIIVKEGLDGFREQIANSSQSGQVLRAANHVGLVAVAGELAIQLGILPWPTGSVNEAAGDAFRDWHAERGGNDPTEVRAAIEQIRGILERYGDSRFDSPNPAADSRPVTDRLGYFHGEGAERQWWIPPQTWRDVLCWGFDAKATAQALIQRGLLLRGYGNETNRPVRVNGQLTRAYVLPASAWTEGTA
jgi:putative DNA primase/helicase